MALYLSDTMEGPMCDVCGHLLPESGSCLLNHDTQRDPGEIGTEPVPNFPWWEWAIFAVLASPIPVVLFLLVKAAFND